MPKIVKFPKNQKKFNFFIDRQPEGWGIMCNKEKYMGVKMRRRNKRKNIIVCIMIVFVCMISVGYAAFSSEFLINGKGTIVSPNEGKAAAMLKSKIVETGDGLYKDLVENDRYVYKGTEPDNYIILDGVTYRIISVESDNTIKVVAQYNIGCMAWDATGSRSASGYCTSTYCNAWGSSTSTLDFFENNVTVMSRETGGNTYSLPSIESSLNIYLNTDFLSGLSTELKKIITPHTHNVGSLKNSSIQTLETDVSQENAYKWRGKISVINVTDYVKASTNTNCKSAYNYIKTSSCYQKSTTHNYLYKTYQWTLSPYSSGNSYYVWRITSDGHVTSTTTNYSSGVWPSFYLKSDIVLTGDGTKEKPYCVEGISCEKSETESDAGICDGSS